MKISGVYKIINTVTNDFYIGSSKNVKSRWTHHKCPSTWKNCPNKQLYQDMQKYGLDKFDFQILANVEPEQLKEKEQQFIEKLQPTYNNRRANGLDFERMEETKKKYHQAKEYKECQKKYHQTKEYKEYQKKYHQTKEYKEYQKKYHQTKEYKEDHKKRCKKYNNQLCSYNGETLTFNALYKRFRRDGIENPIVEANKYILDN